MKNVLIFLLTFGLFANLATAQQDFEKETIRTATFENRGINIVFMGDGYTAQEQNNFIADVRRFSDGLFAISPFSLYANYFNVYAIKVISNDAAGYFGHEIDTSNLLTVNTNTVNNIRNAHFPLNQNRVFVVVLVKTNEGLANAVPNRVLIRGNGRVNILTHEMGHAFGRVTDEYWTGTGQNLNKAPFDTLPENLSWRRWVGQPDNNGGLVRGTVNPYLFGEVAPQSSWIRPSQNCLMRYTDDWRNPQFCPICSQAIIEKVHSLVPSIGNSLPASSNLNNVRNFSLENVFTPNPSTLTYDWYLNDNPIIGAFGSSVEIPIAAFGGAGNNFRVRVEVRDATPLVRSNDNLLEGHIDGVTLYNNTWNVTITQQYYNQQLVVLPIVLKDFTAKVEPNCIRLVWNTLSENDNDHFMVEKSVNGKSFSLLTTVQGNGNTNEPKSYTIFDDKPFTGTSYYKLTQVDLNGGKNVIDTKSVNFTLSAEKYTVYPNPANDHLYWENKQSSNNAIEFSLTDITGRVIYHKVENPSSNNLFMIKPPVKPKPGIYMLRVKEGNKGLHHVKVLFQ